MWRKNVKRLFNKNCTTYDRKKLHHILGDKTAPHMKLILRGAFL